MGQTSVLFRPAPSLGCGLMLSRSSFPGRFFLALVAFATTGLCSNGVAASDNWSQQFYAPAIPYPSSTDLASLFSFAWGPNGNLIAGGKFALFAGASGTANIAQFDGER